MSATGGVAPPRFGSAVPNLIGFSRDILGLFQGAARHGHDVVQVVLVPGLRLYFVNHPELIREVIATRRDQFSKPQGLGDVRPAVGENLQTLDGSMHARHRQLAEPMMAPPSVASYAGEVVGQGVRSRDSWLEGTIDLHRQILETVLARAQRYNLPVGPLLDMLPLASTKKMRRGRARAERFIDEMIRRERAANDPGHSLLAMLLASEPPDGSGALSDGEVRDEALFLFLAGWETIGDALTWTFYELARNPEAQERLQAEVDEVLGGEPATLEHIARLPFVGAVINEALRLYAVGWGMLRQAVGSQQLGPYRIPAKSYVLVSPFVTHRDERWFPGPENFVPERWEGPRQEFVARPFFPFSIGPRTCLGEHFASMALPLLVATMAQRWTFHSASPKPVQPVPQFALRPKGGLRLRVSRR